MLGVSRAIFSQIPSSALLSPIGETSKQSDKDGRRTFVASLAVVGVDADIFYLLYL